MNSRFFRTIRNLFLFTALILIGAGCGVNDTKTNSGTGGVAAKLVWNTDKNISSQAKSSAKTPTGVTTVRIIVTGVGMPTMQKDFPASAGVDGSGIIEGIPAGSGRTVKAQGLDSVNNVMYQGVVTNIIVQAGKTTDIGIIAMVTPSHVPQPGLFTAPANPLNVVLALGASTTFTVLSNGGPYYIEASGADGTSYRLDIPDGALAADTDITMTPVISLAGFSFSGGLGGAIKFEPEGLFFLKDVILTIIPATPVPLENQILFGFTGSGSDIIIGTPADKSSAITLRLQHFSGGGVGNGLSPQEAAILNSIADRMESRLASEVGAALSMARQEALLNDGNSSSNPLDILTSLFTEYENSVVKNRINAAMSASGTCGDATKAMQTVLGYERQRELLGMGQSSVYLQLTNLMTTGDSKCREEKIQECKASKTPAILKSYDMSVARQHALLGASETPFYTDQYYKDTCGEKGVWIGTTTAHYDDKGQFNVDFTANVTFKLDPTASTADTEAYIVSSGSGTATVSTGPLGTCSITAGDSQTFDIIDKGSLTIDVKGNTYSGTGALDLPRNFTMTVTCPASIGSFPNSFTLPDIWLWADDKSYPLTSSTSFNGSRTETDKFGVTYSNSWTFTKQ